MRARPFFLVLLLATACGAAETQPSPEPATAPSLIGGWNIVAIDGRPPRSIGSDAGTDRRPGVGFTAASYGGRTGCNSFGGTGLLRGDRFYGEAPMQTEMGCGELTAQETAITGVMASAPSIAFSGPDAARLTSPKGVLTLRRWSDPTPAEPRFDPPPPLLAGTRWTIRSVDGAYPTAYPLPARSLSFEADRWEAVLPCRVHSGSWRQDGRRVTLTPASAGPGRICAALLRAGDAALGKMLSGTLEFVTGPNRELVMASGGGWLTGEIDRPALKDDAALLSGRWSVAGSKATIAFGQSSYVANDGCNHREGVFVAFGRALYTAPGPSTLAGCNGDARVAAVLAADPRIARTANGVALVSRAGRIDLAKLPGAPLPDSARRGLRAPLSATLGDGRLELSPRTFVVRTSCGSIDGDWNARHLRFSGRDPSDGACALNRRFVRLFNGDVRAVTGPNGELLIVSDHEKAVGQIER